MTWLLLAVAVLAALAVLAVVGGVLSWAVGLRGLWACAAAPAFALTAIALASVTAPWVGLVWSPVPLILLTAILAVALTLIRRRWVRPSTEAGGSRPDFWVLAAIVLGSGFLVWRVCVAIGEPTNFSQTFDNIFHLNGVRYVLDTGNASSFNLGRMTNPGGTLPFYPAAWHALVSLVITLTGVAIPIGVNAVTLVVSAVIWPLGALLLTRTLLGTGRVLSVAAVVAAVGVPAFPFLLMDYGVLFPFQLGLALVPVALAAAVQALGFGARTTMPRTWWSLIFLGTLPGLSLAHPGAFVVVLALTLPMVTLFAWRLSRRTAGRRRILVVLGFVAYAGVGLLLLKVLRPPADARGWPPTLSIPDAVGQVLTASMWYASPSLVVAVAVLAGIVATAVSRRPEAFVALSMYVVAAGLFVVVSSFTYQPLRDVLTGSWYNNIPRLAAIVPMTMVPLAALGTEWVWRMLKRPADASGVRVGRAVRAVGSVAGVAAIALVLTGPVATVSSFVNTVYRIAPDSLLISSDEYALLERLGDRVPEGAVIAGNPWTGTALAYALAGRQVLQPHTLSEVSPDIRTIQDGLRSARAGDAVCAALDRTHTRFVLDFGTREILPGTHSYPGFEDLATSPAVRLVDEQGDARLYEIVACEGQEGP